MRAAKRGSAVSRARIAELFDDVVGVCGREQAQCGSCSPCLGDLARPRVLQYPSKAPRCHCAQNWEVIREDFISERTSEVTDEEAKAALIQELEKDIPSEIPLDVLLDKLPRKELDGTSFPVVQWHLWLILAAGTGKFPGP